METVSVDAEPAERDSPWLTPGVRGIGTASLLADLGHEVPTALLPSFLTSTLGAPAAALGAIEGVSDGLAGACRFSGHAGDTLSTDPPNLALRLWAGEVSNLPANRRVFWAEDSTGDSTPSHGSRRFRRPTLVRSRA